MAFLAKESAAKLKTAGKVAAGVSLAAFGINGLCNHIHNNQIRWTTEHYREFSGELVSVAGSSYPEYLMESPDLPKPAGAKEALHRADRALACYADLLTVPHPYRREYPLINNVDDVVDGPHLSGEDLKNLPEYQRTRKLCWGIRAKLADELRRCQESLQESSRMDSLQDPQTQHHFAALLPKLDILSQRIREGRLMIANNILGWTQKGGTFYKMIGQSEHYEEARAEIRALLDGLGR